MTLCVERHVKSVMWQDADICSVIPVFSPGGTKYNFLMGLNGIVLGQETLDCTNTSFLIWVYSHSMHRGS